MTKLFSKFLLAVLATGTLAIGVQSDASARDFYYGYGHNYNPYYSGYTYDPYWGSGYYRSGWGWQSNPYTWRSGYRDRSLERGARNLLHGLVDEIF